MSVTVSRSVVPVWRNRVVQRHVRVALPQSIRPSFRVLVAADDPTVVPLVLLDSSARRSASAWTLSWRSDLDPCRDGCEPLDRPGCGSVDRDPLTAFSSVDCACDSRARFTGRTHLVVTCPAGCADAVERSFVVACSARVPTFRRRRFIAFREPCPTTAVQGAPAPLLHVAAGAAVRAFSAWQIRCSDCSWTARAAGRPWTEIGAKRKRRPRAPLAQNGLTVMRRLNCWA